LKKEWLDNVYDISDKLRDEKKDEDQQA